MKRETCKKHTRILSLLLALALLCSLAPPAVYAAERACELVEGWTGADLTDTAKYAASNCTVAAGTDDTIGGYVTMKATNYNPTFTVSCSFDITKYNDPTVGFWLKQTRTNEGKVYLQSEGNNVAEASFTPEADTWIFVTVSLTASADAIQFVPYTYGNPSIGSIYFGNKVDVEKIPETASEPVYEVVEDWSGAELTDTAKYVPSNCTVTAGTDNTIGGYVAMKANNYESFVSKMQVSESEFRQVFIG